MKTTKLTKIGLSIAATALLLCSATPATAQTSDKERIQQLEDTVRALEAQNKKILQMLEQMQNKPAAVAPAAPTIVKTAPSGTASAAPTGTAPVTTDEDAPSKDDKRWYLGDNDMRIYWKNGLNIQSGDGETFKGKFGGRIHFDQAIIGQDSNVRSVVGDAPSGARFRRARIFFSGKYNAGLPIYFKNQYDWADGKVALKDVYAGITEVPYLGSIQAGNFHEPFSLEELTSSRYITFVERASGITTFGADRNIGVMAQNNFLKDDRALWSVGFFSDIGGTGRGTLDSDQRITARISGLPYWEDDGRKYIHLGASVMANNSQDDMLRYRTRPETSLAPYYVDTGAFAADSALMTHGEFLATFGAFSFQTEYFHTQADTITGPEANFDSFYLLGSYFLTGEHRPYKKSLGALDRVTPNRNFGLNGGGLGAWEIGLRYSRTDLNGGLIAGGRVEDISAGLNWYLNPNLRAMVNYIHSGLNRNGLKGNSHIVTSRVSFDF